MSTAAFNTEEIQGFISRGWLDAQEKLKNATLSEKEKPQVYKCNQPNSSNKNSSASKWDLNKASTMANQKDFLVEIRRQLKD